MTSITIETFLFAAFPVGLVRVSAEESISHTFVDSYLSFLKMKYAHDAIVHTTINTHQGGFHLYIW